MNRNTLKSLRERWATLTPASAARAVALDFKSALREHLAREDWREENESARRLEWPADHRSPLFHVIRAYCPEGGRKFEGGLLGLARHVARLSPWRWSDNEVESSGWAIYDAAQSTPEGPCVLGVFAGAKGQRTCSATSIRAIFRSLDWLAQETQGATEGRDLGVILWHPHPTGDSTPSQADYACAHAVRCALQAGGLAVPAALVLGRREAAMCLPEHVALPGITWSRVPW